MSEVYALAYPWRLNLEAVARSSGVHPTSSGGSWSWI